MIIYRMSQNRKIAQILLIMLVFTYGCAGKHGTEQTDYVAGYLNAIQNIDGVEANHNERFTALARAFSNLKQPGLKEILESAYAEELYFNDTIHTHSQRDELIKYLLESAAKAELVEVEIQDIATSGNNYYLRWVMVMRFEAAGKAVESKSIGISHIRLNADQKIVLHQDYWDSSQGLYQHLPVVGYLINRVRAKL